MNIAGLFRNPIGRPSADDGWRIEIEFEVLTQGKWARVWPACLRGDRDAPGPGRSDGGPAPMSAAGSDPRETIVVKVRDRDAEDACWGHGGPWSPILRTVTISAFCQVPGCGERRGEVRGLNQHEDGVSFHVNVWKNPCGHVDYYPDVLREARQLAAGWR